MNLEFLNPEYFILLAVIPLIILWNYLKRDNLTNSIKFSNSEAFGDSGNFYSKLKSICDLHDNTYYKAHKKWCDEYFFLKHRNEARGVGGVFFDYINTGSFKNDFSYTKDIGDFFLNYIKYIFDKYSKDTWTEKEKHMQMIKRGRYVEFNLLYDRGTKFGLETGGNTEAILMSMPPYASWD